MYSLAAARRPRLRNISLCTACIVCKHIVMSRCVSKLFIVDEPDIAASYSNLMTIIICWQKQEKIETKVTPAPAKKESATPQRNANAAFKKPAVFKKDSISSTSTPKNPVASRPTSAKNGQVPRKTEVKGNKSPASAGSTPRSGGVRTGDRKTTPGSGTQRRGGGTAQRRPFGRGGANQTGSQPQRRDNRGQQGQNDRRGMRGNQRQQPQQQRSDYQKQTPERRQDQRTGCVAFIIDIESRAVAKDCRNLKVSMRY